MRVRLRIGDLQRTRHMRGPQRPAAARPARPLPGLRRQHAQTLAAIPLLTDEGFTDIRTIGGDRS